MIRSPTGPILTAAEMRAAEEACVARGISLADLMDRAGAAVAEAAWRFGGGRPILILCGPGNNGGDGYVAARLLKARGADVRVAALADPKTQLAQAARAKWDGPVEDLAQAKPAPVLVDALFGTGLTRPIEKSVQDQLNRLAAAAAFRMAVDLPSGLDTDTGEWLGAIPHELSLALGALKPAHLLQPGAWHSGHVRIADIGITAQSDVHVLEPARLFVPGPSAQKYRRGYVVVIGGAMGGAAMLAAKAAMPLAGYVALVGARRHGPDALVHRRWDDVADDKRVGTILIGPGLGRDEAARVKLSKAMSIDRPLVMDADALMLVDPESIAMTPNRKIITPHEGEFSALFGEMPGSKVERAVASARRCDAVVVLKGADTVIAAPDGQARISQNATGWLASAGTGDVLAGLCAALVANLRDPFAAACNAVWLHNEAARIAGPGLTADTLAQHVPAAIARNI